MPLFTPREKRLLAAALGLLRHDVPHQTGETAQLAAAGQEFSWPSEAEIDELFDKLTATAAPDALPTVDAPLDKSSRHVV